MKYKQSQNYSPSVEMSVDERVRWLCLIESIQVADDMMKEHDIDPEGYDWVRPIAIANYIEERFHARKHDYLYELKHGITDKTDEN